MGCVGGALGCWGGNGMRGSISQVFAPAGCLLGSAISLQECGLGALHNCSSAGWQECRLTVLFLVFEWSLAEAAKSRSRCCAGQQAVVPQGCRISGECVGKVCAMFAAA